jgi:hypothetical protein
MDTARDMAALDEAIEALESLNTARDCFLDLLANAKWCENVDAEITLDGKYIDRTSHTLHISNRDLSILADALGFDQFLFETPKQSIDRHLRVRSQQAAE